MNERYVRTAIFGAGQMGKAAAEMLGPGHELVAFIDNDIRKQGCLVNGKKVMSPGEAAQADIGLIVIAVQGTDRRNEIRRQIVTAGFTGNVTDISLLETLDPRAGAFRLIARRISDTGITGDTAELGVYKGDFAEIIQRELSDRTIHLYDTFDGFREEDVLTEKKEHFSGARTGDFSDTSAEAVLRIMPYPGRAVIHKGWFPDSFKGSEELTFAFVSIDADLYEPTRAALPLFWERLSGGGVIMVHDYYSDQYSGTAQAVNEFCSANGLVPVPVCDMHGSCILIKQRPVWDISRNRTE